MAYQSFPPPNSGKWTTGLCGCFEDCESLCIGFWCPCVLIGRYIEILDQGATSCATGGALWCLIQSCIGWGCLYSCGYRTKLRQKFGLPASPCMDCCTECCCPHCSFWQITRELKNRNINPADGYQAVKHIYEQPPQAPGAPGQQGMYK